MKHLYRISQEDRPLEAEVPTGMGGDRDESYGASLIKQSYVTIAMSAANIPMAGANLVKSIFGAGKK